MQHLVWSHCSFCPLKECWYIFLLLHMLYITNVVLYKVNKNVDYMQKLTCSRSSFCNATILFPCSILVAKSGSSSSSIFTPALFCIHLMSDFPRLHGTAIPLKGRNMGMDLLIPSHFTWLWKSLLAGIQIIEEESKGGLKKWAVGISIENQTPKEERKKKKIDGQYILMSLSVSHINTKS